MNESPDSTPRPALEPTPPASVLDNLPAPESDRHRGGLRGFSAEQMIEVQRIAQDIATQQIERVAIVTGNFIITFVAVLSSALGLATALAWNKAIGEWLPTVRVFNSSDPLTKDFTYAAFMTLLTVAVISMLVLATSRIKGENLINRKP